MADYVPAIQPMGLFGLYAAGEKARRDEEMLAASTAAKAQKAHMDALSNALELGYKIGDSKIATALFDRSTELGSAQDYDAIKQISKLGKQKNEAPSEQAATGLAQGLAAQLPEDPQQAALAGLRAEEARAQQGQPPIPDLASRALGYQAENAQKETAYRARQDYVAAGKYQTFFNPETGKYGYARGDERDKKDRLTEGGYLPVSQFNVGGTPKDFAAGLTPTAATRIQNSVQSLQESGDRLAILGQKYKPEFFEYSTAAKVWALDKASKAGIPISDKQATLLGDYQEFMAVAGEETLAYTVAMAASTFTDRLREHISSLRFEPGMNAVTFQKRLERLTQVGKQGQARLAFALKNGIVKAADFDPAGNLTTDAKDRLEKAIPMAIPDYSMPASNMRIDKLMENRYDAFQKEAALNKIPPAERDAWVDQMMNAEFTVQPEPPVGGLVQDPIEADFLKNLKGVPVTPLPGISPEEIRREREPQLFYRRNQ